MAEVVQRCFAVQAQDLRAAALGIRARSIGLTEADAYRALGAERHLVRGWFMRGTLYMVAADDAEWLRELLAPQLLRRSERRYRELGLGPGELARGEQVIRDALSEGPRTRDEIAERMTNEGLNAAGQVPFHLIRRSALLGTACSGPVRDDGSATYVLTDGWLPASAGPSGPKAVEELLFRYLLAHGPVAPADFATWSGLGQAPVRSAWKQLSADGRLQPCRIDGVAGYALAAGEAPRLEPSGDVRLLPSYDNYMVGFADRQLSVPPGHERQVWPGGGQISPTVLVDGLVHGVWRRDRVRGAVVSPGDDVPVATAAARALDEEVRDISRFLGA